MAEYAHPEVLVPTAWVAEHTNDPKLRIVEVDVDTSAYDRGHIPGAIGWNWQTQLQDTGRRDLIDKRAFEVLLSRSGSANETNVITYGDDDNWVTAWACRQVT